MRFSAACRPERSGRTSKRREHGTATNYRCGAVVEYLYGHIPLQSTPELVPGLHLWLPTVPADLHCRAVPSAAAAGSVAPAPPELVALQQEDWPDFVAFFRGASAYVQASARRMVLTTASLAPVLGLKESTHADFNCQVTMVREGGK